MTASTPRRFALIAGEASGDLLGAALIADLKRLHPDAEFVGIGGEAMRAQGLNVWHDYHELAVMGLVEVLKHLPRLLRLRKSLRERLLAYQPDVVIGIDAPDFNLGLERWLKRRGVRTVHYVSPSIWAWREGRAAKIRSSADLVLCLFPMEPPLYAVHGMPAAFVGHPLAKSFAMEPDRGAARASLGIADDRKMLAMLPGSRSGEIRRLLPVFLDAAQTLRGTNAESLDVLIPAANAHCRALINEELAKRSMPNVNVIDGQAHAAMIAADAVLLASGTAALEALLAKRLMVVGYRIASLTYLIVKLLRLLKVDRYSLPNVLAAQTLVTECMQQDCSAEKLAAALRPLLDEPQRYESVQARYRDIHAALMPPSPDAAASAIDILLAQR